MPQVVARSERAAPCRSGPAVTPCVLCPQGDPVLPAVRGRRGAHLQVLPGLRRQTAGTAATEGRGRPAAAAGPEPRGRRWGCAERALARAFLAGRPHPAPPAVCRGAARFLLAPQGPARPRGAAPGRRGAEGPRRRALEAAAATGAGRLRAALRRCGTGRGPEPGGGGDTRPRGLRTVRAGVGTERFTLPCVSAESGRGCAAAAPRPSGPHLCVAGAVGADHASVRGSACLGQTGTRSGAGLLPWAVVGFRGRHFSHILCCLSWELLRRSFSPSEALPDVWL